MIALELSPVFLVLFVLFITRKKFREMEGLIGKSDFDFYDHKDAADWHEAEHKIIADGRTEYIHEDGGKILHTIKMPFYIDPLNEKGILGLLADVTELETLRKQIGGKS